MVEDVLTDESLLLQHLQMISNVMTSGRKQCFGQILETDIVNEGAWAAVVWAELACNASRLVRNDIRPSG